MELLQLPLPIPDYGTVSRRHGALQIHVSPTLARGHRHVIIDATGLRVYGAGEWRVWKHRVRRRRTLRSADKNPPEIGVPALADAEQLGFAATRMLAWYQPEKSGEVEAIFELLWSRDDHQGGSVAKFATYTIY